MKQTLIFFLFIRDLFKDKEKEKLNNYVEYVSNYLQQTTSYADYIAEKLNEIK